jgi:hypothetical protein
MSSDAARYFEQLRSHLRLGERIEADVLRELEAHVEDRVSELVSRGVPESSARRIALRGFGRPRTLAHLMRQAHLVTTWGETFLGAAPLLLLAAVIGLDQWRTGFVVAAVALAVVAVTLYGLWLGRPAWFYPWAGVALTIPLYAGYLAFLVLKDELPGTLGGNVRLWPLMGVAGAGLYFPMGVVVVSGAVLVAVRRDWLDASVLLSPLPASLAWIIALHRAGGVSATASLGPASLALGSVYLAMAVAVVVFLKAPTRQLRVATLVGSALFLLLASSLGTDASVSFLTLGARAVLLIAFLLSPALVARHA